MRVSETTALNTTRMKHTKQAAITLTPPPRPPPPTLSYMHFFCSLWGGEGGHPNDEDFRECGIASSSQRPKCMNDLDPEFLGDFFSCINASGPSTVNPVDKSIRERRLHCKKDKMSQYSIVNKMHNKVDAYSNKIIFGAS